ncbi:hypothetical protein WMY93_012965 [Mugilogobius chulae]|uniref:PDZ domain-containing protein n=1 Tax=Mugilogobius chulae TaxID=88201 RepID=A0AAW0P248_9GOBI
MKYKKFITIMQAALGVAPLNKRELIPAPRKLWRQQQQQQQSRSETDKRRESETEKRRESETRDWGPSEVYVLRSSGDGYHSLHWGPVHSVRVGGALCPLQGSAMEETVWEQYTVTLQRDPKMGFGMAVSGGRDNPNVDSGETSIMVSDVLQEDRRTGFSSRTIPHTLLRHGHRQCLVPRAERALRRLQGRSRPQQGQALPQPRQAQAGRQQRTGPGRQRRASQVPQQRTQPGGQLRARRGRGGGRYRSREGLNDPSPPPRDLEPLDKPINVMLVKNRPSEEYGLRLGSQIFIKQMTSSGLAAKDGNLQEGDIILKINGTVTENLSLHDAGKLIEKSRGKLQLVVQRDQRQILVRIPPLADSDSDNDDNMSYF